jgi:hypothetical protein
MIPKTMLFALVVAAMLVGTAYVAVVYPAASVTSSTTSATSSTTTTSTACTTATSSATTSSTTSSSTSTTTTSTNVFRGTFTYSPSSPVQVDAVTATTSVGQNGTVNVTFQVLFTNEGSSAIFVMGGCSGGLSTSIEGNQNVLRQVTGGPLCDCAAVILTLQNGQNHTSTSPGCWSGYNYQLIGHGDVTMNMTLNWSTSNQGFDMNNSTSIRAQFAF